MTKIFNDWTHKAPCGCTVTFLANTLHAVSRMECCDQHNKRDQTLLRDEIRALAKEAYALARPALSGK
jgi:hypothetical protein